jgi:hypothetical protein
MGAGSRRVAHILRSASRMRITEPQIPPPTIGRTITTRNRVTNTVSNIIPVDIVFISFDIRLSPKGLNRLPLDYLILILDV